MNNAETVVVILAIVGLVLAVGVFVLLTSRGKTEQALRQKIDDLTGQLQEASKGTGQVSELNNTIAELRSEKAGLLSNQQQLQDHLTGLEKDLAKANADADNARQSLIDSIKSEKEACQASIQREKEACSGLIEAEAKKCADLIHAEKDACAKIIAAKDSEIEVRDKEIAGLKEFIDTAQATLKDHFKSLSQETLKDVATQFEHAAKKLIDQNSEATEQNVKLHKEQIAKLLQPVGTSLEQLDRQIKDNDEKRAKAEAEIHTVIRESADTNKKLSEALRKPVMRGTYGEVKLQSLLEACGLTEGEDYALQVPVFGDDEQGRVDALVNMAQGKKLVIDSKNLLEPFVEYANAETPEESARLLKEFQRICRETLRSLSLRRYAEKVNTIDAVLMFLPDEGMYYAALESDRQLIAKMTEERVYVVSPTSLLPILKSVSYILGLERQNKNTQKVVDAGRLVFDALRGLMEDLRVLGTNLDRSTKNYNDVVKRFEDHLVPRSTKLQKMKVNRGKELPELAEVRTEVRSITVALPALAGSLPEIEPSLIEAIEDVEDDEMDV